MPDRYDTSPIGTGHNWVTKTDPVTGLGSFVRAVVHALIRDGHAESEAIQIAEGVMKRWASGQGHVTPKTRAKAAAAVAHWEALKAAAHAERAVRDGGFGGAAVTEGSTAGGLLPVGPSPKQAAKVVAFELHAFRGSNTGACSRCGQAATAPIHLRRRDRRRDDHGTATTAPRRSNGAADRRRISAQFNADADRLEPHLRQALDDLFDKQRQATISRLVGKRGRRMLRAAQPPGGDGGPGADTPPAASGTPSPPAGAVDAAQIFDLAHWAAKTAEAAAPAYAQAAQGGAGSAAAQLGQTTPLPDTLAPIIDLMKTRANRMAADVSNTTFNQIQDTLADGIQQGESTQELADRVEHVFDMAHSRAETIARTETIGALNEAAHAYASQLRFPVVKEWVAHHDDRTRTTHRAADGQTRSVDVPFDVGGSPMMHPGDPDAPPDEVCNCRCTAVFRRQRRPQEVAA